LLLFSFGGYGLALAALALVVFRAYDSYPFFNVHLQWHLGKKLCNKKGFAVRGKKPAEWKTFSAGK